MITIDKVYGRVSVDKEALDSASRFVEVKLLNGRDEFPTNTITVGKAGLKDKGGYQPREDNTSMVQDYLPLAYKAASIASRTPAGVGAEYEELLQEAALALTEAAQRYDINRNNGFAAYALPYIQGHLKNHLNPSRNGMMNHVDLPFGYGEDLNSATAGDNLSHDRTLVLLGAIEALPRKQKYAVEAYYYKGYTLREIGSHTNTTYKAVAHLLKRATGELRKQLSEAFK